MLSNELAKLNLKIYSPLHSCSVRNLCIITLFINVIRPCKLKALVYFYGFLFCGQSIARAGSFNLN